MRVCSKTLWCHLALILTILEVHIFLDFPWQLSNEYSLQTPTLRRPDHQNHADGELQEDHEPCLHRPPNPLSPLFLCHRCIMKYPEVQLNMSCTWFVSACICSGKKKGPLGFWLIWLTWLFMILSDFHRIRQYQGPSHLFGSPRDGSSRWPQLPTIFWTTNKSKLRGEPNSSQRGVDCFKTLVSYLQAIIECSR